MGSRLRDRRGVARINARLRNVSLGNLGDVKAVGNGVSEMRIHYGPGYRIYYMRSGPNLVVLLCGGDKGVRSRHRTCKATGTGVEMTDG